MTATDQEAAVIAAQQALAVTDAATLTAFQTQMESGTFTVTSFMTALGGLPAQLGDPARAAQATSCFQNFQANLNQVAALVTAAQAAATPA